MTKLSRFSVLVASVVLMAGCGGETKSVSAPTNPATVTNSGAVPANAAGAAGLATGGFFDAAAPVAPAVPPPGNQFPVGQFPPGVFPGGQIPGAPLTGVPLPGAAGFAPPDAGAIPGVGGQPGLPGTPPTVPGASPTPAAGSEFVPAQAGVGIKGRSLDQHQGIIVTPAKTLFTAREKVVFEIAIPHSLNLYKATNGEGPRTHEEFMQKIVQEQNIQLPQLPAGHQYRYDPQTEQLMVERPKK